MKREFPKVLSESEYRQRMPLISEELNTLCTKTLLEVNGGSLYCESYLKDTADKNIVIIHGFTEFSAKYHEMVSYLLSLDFNVFVYDQRGHGFSHRQAEDLRLIHIDSFDTYVSDLEAVVEKLIKPGRESLPLYLFSHSMGGAVSLLYMMKRPNAINKALLCAPMISPQTKNVPRPIVAFISRLHGKRYGWDKRFLYTGDFNPTVDIRETLDSSRARFEAAMKLRIANKEYQSSAATNRWMHEAVTVQSKLMKKSKAELIETEVLILSASNDTVVKNKYHSRFVKYLRNGRLITVPCAKHNIFFSHGQTLNGFYKILFEFFS